MNYLILKQIGYNKTKAYNISGKDLKDAIEIALKTNYNYFGWGINDCPDINTSNDILSEYDFNKYVDFIDECITWNEEILVFESKSSIINSKLTNYLESIIKNDLRDICKFYLKKLSKRKKKFRFDHKYDEIRKDMEKIIINTIKENGLYILKNKLVETSDSLLIGDLKNDIMYDIDLDTFKMIKYTEKGIDVDSEKFDFVDFYVDNLMDVDNKNYNYLKSIKENVI